MPTLIVIQHVPHEDLGTIDTHLKQLGCQVRVVRTYMSGIDWPRLNDADGIIIMGGPMNVYQHTQYPFLKKEISLILDALRRQIPILGVCLGAQLIAVSLGGSVYPAKEKEIGWFKIKRSVEKDPLFEIFKDTEFVFQLHGDTFSLPSGAVVLSESRICKNQAFRFSNNVYGLQFHVEVDELLVNKWLSTRELQAEIKKLGNAVDINLIKSDSRKLLGRLNALSNHITTEFFKLK